MSNRDKLKALLIDVFLLEEDEFSFKLKRSDIDTWDSLGIVAMAVGIQETFGYHMKSDEATGVTSIQDIIDLLEQKDILIDE